MLTLFTLCSNVMIFSTHLVDSYFVYKISVKTEWNELELIPTDLDRIVRHVSSKRIRRIASKFSLVVGVLGGYGRGSYSMLSLSYLNYTAHFIVKIGRWEPISHQLSVPCSHGFLSESIFLLLGSLFCPYLDLSLTSNIVCASPVKKLRQIWIRFFLFYKNL